MKSLNRYQFLVLLMFFLVFTRAFHVKLFSSFYVWPCKSKNLTMYCWLFSILYHLSVYSRVVHTRSRAYHFEQIYTMLFLDIRAFIVSRLLGNLLSKKEIHSLPTILHHCISWVLHIAKVWNFFSSRLPMTEGLIPRPWPFFFFQKWSLFRFFSSLLLCPNLHNVVSDTVKLQFVRRH